MKNVFLIMILLVFILGASAWGQSADKAEIQSVRQDMFGLKPANKPFSLIDLSRVKWSHSYSVAFFSGGGSSGSIGLYSGSIFYELTHSLSLTLNLNILHNPESFVSSSAHSDASFFPAVNLDYHPSDNFRMSVNFISYPGVNYNPYYPYSLYDWRRLHR
ncbi:MAG: hypothetical protein JSU69_08715 [Candidatus Zixiibacteriota bacterium]|nr:MAG: hypothetical protein JSU69_08715 [candidate division Zixibacteria bacterium]